MMNGNHRLTMNGKRTKIGDHMFSIPETIKITTKDGRNHYIALYKEKIKNIKPEDDWMNNEMKQ